MKRMRMLILALFSLVLSAVIAMLSYRVLQNRLAGEMSQIVVAAEKLPLGARLTEQHLRTVSWPRTSPLAGSFTAPAELVGRGVVVPMGPNEPVLESKLAPREAGAGLSSAIPTGMRAVAAKVDQVIGVAGFVLPGTRVDVILTGSPNDKWSMDTSKVILENVQVLSAGTNLERDEEGKPQDVPVVTLLVTPEDAQKLALASVDGRIQLALRNPLDLEAQNPDAVRKEALYRSSAMGPLPPPEKPLRSLRRPADPVAPPPITVELIQGNTRETMTFEKKQR